jgi:rhomboid protease GluP
VICTSCGVLVGVRDDACYNCGRRNPGLWGFAPALRSLGQDLGFGPFVIGACALMFVLTLVFSGEDTTLMSGRRGLGAIFGFLSPSIQSLFLFGASGSLPMIGLGRWWTVLSAAWLHGSLLHIVMNVMGLRQLVPVTADFYGPGRTVIIYTAGAIVGFALSSLAGAYLPYIPFLSGARFTMGASAPIFGLMGAILYYGHRTGSRFLTSQVWSYVGTAALFGLAMPGIDNWAHGGGMLGGYVAARILDPLKPERIDHMVIALGCIVLSVLSVIASVLNGVQYFE